MSDAKSDFVTIVSGLPRSGTSMMMRMLESGGMTVLTDEIRTADIDNPRGYYEYEAVKRTKQDASWLDGARGKAVKMVYQLLYDLPEGYEYRVLLMQRNLDEVLKSQQKMLERLGKGGEKISDATMSQIFRGQLEQCRKWLDERPHFAYLEVHYNEMVADPGAQIATINEFLGGGLSVEGMRSVVEPELYRNRM
jgi:hypothetical protein